MPSRRGKHQTWTPFMFRCPPEKAAIVKAAAEAMGVDYSSILNWLVAEACPVLEKIIAGRPVLLPLLTEESAPGKEAA